MLKPIAYFINTQLTPIAYKFLNSVQLQVRKPDGKVVLCGFGIGEVIQVLEPRVQSLAARSEMWDQIPLEDGSYILNMGSNCKLEKVWP